MPVYPCNHDVVRVMLGMAGQWVIEGMSGRIVCLRMEVLPVVLSSLGIAPSADLLMQVQHMAAVMMGVFNAPR